ncbi:MAG: GerMN domain-containing protein [Lachnospiraceae bacterium]
MKRKVFLLWGCICLLLVMTGCSTQSENIENAKYYVSADETHLVEEVFTPSDEATKAMAEELVNLLGETPDSGGRLSLLPSGVEVISYTIKDKVLTIDFSSEYSNMTATREILTRAGIVKTLCQIPSIDYVQISVEGKEITDSKGDAIGNMDESMFLEKSGEKFNSYLHAELSLYFTNEAGETLEVESRRVYYSSNVTLERVVVEQLVEGPKEGAYPTLPGDTIILGVTTAKRICYVNFNQIFSDSALPIQEKIPIYSIANSIIANCPVDKVQISINGESNVTFRENMNLNQFYEKNDELVSEVTGA